MTAKKRQKLLLLQEQALGLAEESILEIVSDSVVLQLLEVLSHGVRRFSELHRTLSRTSSKTVSDRLKKLEAQGLITRTLHAEVPPRVEYALSEKGQEFISILRTLVEWNRSWE